MLLRKFKNCFVAQIPEKKLQSKNRKKKHLHLLLVFCLCQRGVLASCVSFLLFMLDRFLSFFSSPKPSPDTVTFEPTPERPEHDKDLLLSFRQRLAPDPVVIARRYLSPFTPTDNYPIAHVPKDVWDLILVSSIVKIADCFAVI
jgi:hypothetical protein